MDTQQGSNTTDAAFPRFTRLPIELRTAIWELCLPTRVIPLSALVIGHEHRSTKPSRWQAKAVPAYLKEVFFCPCVISEVCRESRAVVLSRRKSGKALGLPWLGGHSWFDPRTDTILVNCDVFSVYRTLWAKVQRALGLCAGPESRHVRVGINRLVADYGYKPGTREAVNEAHCKDVEGGVVEMRQRTWPVMMGSIVVRTPLTMEYWTARPGLVAQHHAVLVNLGDAKERGWLEGLEKAPVGLDKRDIKSHVRDALRDWKQRKDMVTALSTDAGFVREKGPAAKGPYPALLVCWREHTEMVSGITGISGC